MKSKKTSILFICTEDWFFNSHFLPLNEAALSMDGKISTAICCGTKEAWEGLEKMGFQVFSVDFSRRSNTPFSALKLVWQLIRIIREQKPNIIHFIALKPVLIGGLVSMVLPKAAKVYHVTGLGTIAEGKSWPASIFRGVAFGLLTLYLKPRNSWLIAENPDDLAFLRQYGHISSDRTSLFGGAGVDPDFWSQMPMPDNEPPHIAFAGRMIWTKGVDVLIEAMKLLNARGIKLRLDLYGEPDRGNPNEISKEILEYWNRLPGVKFWGQMNNIRDVWAETDICVVSTRTREGMPRSMLEAASCGRPLIVTDVPGPRHFVRDGVEGLVVPPEDPQALADAMQKLASNPQLCHIMGNAARQRLLDGYTEGHVREKVQKVYKTLLDQS